MNRTLAALSGAALLLTACSSPTHKAPDPTVITSSVFSTEQSRDQQFLNALQASPYVQEYTVKTQQDLTSMASNDCTMIETGHSGQAVVTAMNMTANSAAVRFFVRTAIQTYCPQFAAELANLIGN